MNNTLIIGVAVVAILGIGALLLTGTQEPTTINGELSDSITQDDTATPGQGNEITTEPPRDDLPAPEPITIVDLAVQSPELTTLVSTVETAGLIETLTTAGPYTVFAPNDAAFAEIPEETLATLTMPENIEELQAILGLHVVNGIVTSEDLVDGMTVTTLTGDELTISVTQEGTVTIGGATVTDADITADNGIIHIINTVITEPA